MRTMLREWTKITLITETFFTVSVFCLFCMTLPITQAQYDLLNVLSRQPYNLSQAARILGKARSTVTLTSHTLDDKGWVEEVDIEANGRYLTTTEKGDIVVEAVRKL